MKKRISELFMKHGIKPCSIEYNRYQPDFCTYTITFYINNHKRSIDGEYDVYDKEEGKVGMLKRIESQLINYIKSDFGNKQEAEKLIRELVPELQELKAGCRLIHANSKKRAVITCIKGKDIGIMLFSGENRCGCDFIRKKDTVCELNSDYNYWIVVGADIYLHHIQKVVHTRANDIYNNRVSFHQQSEEFYKFIVDVLK